MKRNLGKVINVLRGDASELRGDVTELRGDVDGCEITKNDRDIGIQIEDLIK